MHCSYSCAVNRKIVPKALVSFLDMLSPGIDAMDVKSKRLDVSLMLSLFNGNGVASYFP